MAATDARTLLLAATFFIDADPQPTGIVCLADAAPDVTLTDAAPDVVLTISKDC